jgi:uncharacterized protein involved in response to NO
MPPASSNPPAPSIQRFALLDMGFRPFYLAASLFAALSIALWALQFSGAMRHAYLAGPVWHAHEMLFGFAQAVIVGFLLTAGRNWSGQPTLAGPSLAMLVGLWFAARVLVLTPFAWAAAAANIAFPLAAALALAIALIKGSNRRNYFFVALLTLMAVAAGGVHLAQLGLVHLPAWAGIQLGLDVVLFILSVMAGRVIPMFTNNGVPGAQALKQPVVEQAALALVILVALAGAAGMGGPPLAVLLALACIAHAVRWILWKPWKTLRTPLVWVLHAAYVWVPIYFALRGLAALGIVATSSATHALTVGAMGGLIMGMMTRTARGHTARALEADRIDTACYVLVLSSAIARVAIPLIAPQAALIAVGLSSALWSAGFGLFAVRYWPVLMRARLDGKPG